MRFAYLLGAIELLACLLGWLSGGWRIALAMFLGIAVGRATKVLAEWRGRQRDSSRYWMWLYAEVVPNLKAWEDAVAGDPAH